MACTEKEAWVKDVGIEVMPLVALNSYGHSNGMLGIAAPDNE